MSGVIEYRQEKMAGSLERVGAMQIGIIGTGAVGSIIAETCYQHGVGVEAGHLYLNDFDQIEGSNYTKQSGVYKAEDCGRPKVMALAERINDIVGKNNYCIPINGDCCDLGPEFYAKLDVVFVAVDNFKARLHINKNIKMASKIPWVITAGTGINNAESICVDMVRLCMRDLWAESWIQQEKKNTSCRFAYEEQVNAGVTPTSKLLSGFAALLAFSHFNDLADGKAGIVNTRREVLMTAKGIEMSTAKPLARKDCPDCNLEPAANLTKIKGSIDNMTVEEFLSKVEQETGNENIVLHVDTFVINDYCPHCLKRKKVMKPAKRLKQEELLCISCEGKSFQVDIPAPEIIHEISKVDKELLNLTLHEVGIQYYGYLHVTEEMESILQETENKDWYFTVTE